MDIWETAIAFVLKQEGGAEGEHDPNDPGGFTKFGISSKAYPNISVATLTLEDAKAIYRRDYWEACRCDELPPAFAIAVFDTAVNQGVGKAIRLLQIALNVTVDGVLGSKTITAAHKADRYRVKKFLAERLAAYARLMSEKPNLLVFAVNWSYRVVSLAEAILLIQEPIS